MTAILGTLQTGASTLSDGAWAAAVDASSSRDPHDAVTIAAGPATSVVRSRNASEAHGAYDDLLVAVDGRPEALGSRGGESIPATLARRFRTEGPELFTRLQGRFSVVVVDAGSGTVHLCRDRVGGRPLTYARTGSGWCWSSEPGPLVGLLPHRRIDPVGLQEAVHFRWLVGSSTLVSGVHNVMPGTLVTLTPDGAETTVVRETRFTEPAESGTRLEWEERLLAGLRSSIAALPAHDGRLGVLLSGGVDSSLLAALALEQGLDFVAITPTWPEHPNPELPRAIRYARHMGIEHRIIECDNAFVAARFPWVIERMQCIPKHYHTFGLAGAFEAVAGEVDVFLYGEGADTLLGGSNRTTNYAAKRRKVELVPAPLRELLALPLPRSERSRWGRLRDLLVYDVHQQIRHSGKVDSGPLLRAAFPGVDFAASPNPAADARWGDLGKAAHLRRKDYLFVPYMAAALETVDRIGSPFGIEVHSPFLSDEILDWGTRFPHALRNDERGAKPIVKALGARYFPEEWMHEPKLGFPTPIGGWLGGPLAGALERAREGHPALEGVFRPEVVARLDLQRDYELIWSAMCLTEFARRFLAAEAPLTAQPA